ncbi:unnamed protein product [Vicia faba]|uniref:Glutamyl-tRNA reductase n=1 Tax=Vicia faba TaxID=3906 RepID=A0AAV1AMK0_VICFA|nr:unnamed protein product [Vicia faba]
MMVGYTKENSSLVVIGLSVHITPVELREKLAIPEAEWPRAIGELCGLNHIEEAAVLSTCNRMEIYVVALSQHRGIKEVTEWMSSAAILLSNLSFETVGNVMEPEQLCDAVNFILSLQNRNGGFASYELTRSYAWLEKINPTETFEDITIDYQYVECTSAAIQSLTLFTQRYPQHRKVEIETCIAKAANFIESVQLADGSWYGSWGVCFTYGTWFGIIGLIRAGKRYKDSKSIRKACEFLLSKQDKVCGGIPASELSQYLFLLYNKDATQHLFEVSAGLDSLVMGEGQILAQVKQVVKAGQGVNGFGRNISGLFKHAITVGKRVRTETNISAGAVSVSSATVELAVMKLPDQASHGNARMLVIGAGKMGKLVIKHLVAKGCKNMVVVNRTEERVSAIRDEINDVEIIYKPLSDMLECVGEADVVFTSTASENPLILKQHVKELPFVSEEMGRKRLFVDISVPRNVGSCVDDLESVKVYNVDNLKEVVAANKEDRLRKAMEAQVIIGEESGQFETWRDSLETVPTIKKLRAYAERLRIAEVEKCLGKMSDEDINKKTQKAVDDLGRGIVNKMLHGPMQHLRCDGSDSRTLSETLENMHALNRMFGLETEVSVLEQKIRAKVEKKP